jgi:hypothetical protein
MPPFGAKGSFELRPGEAKTTLVHLSSLYEIQLGADYTVQVKYFLGMPFVDGSGKPITQREISYTLKAKSGEMPR